MSYCVTADQLQAIMGRKEIDYSQHVDACNRALEAAQCTTKNRAAMFLAQVGHESGGLRWFRELSDGKYLRGRPDLGHAAHEGEQFKGAGPLQITGKVNYRAFGQWCLSQGLVSDPDVFVKDAYHKHSLGKPILMEEPGWGWLAAAWYWAIARPDINSYADKGDFVTVTKRINGGLNHYKEREILYHIALNNLTRKEVSVMEFVLPYERNQITQDTGYYCGPASCQTIIGAATGNYLPENDLARQLGTHRGGTDYIGQFPAVLNKFIPNAGYKYRDMPNDPATQKQKDQLWEDLILSLTRARKGVVANIVAPPSNYPKAVAPSTKHPQYSGGTVYHYVAIMGVGEDENGKRVWVADSGFAPYGGWWSFDQLATLIPPKGYAYATTPVDSTEGLFVLLSKERQEDLAHKIDVIHSELTKKFPSRSGFRTTDDGVDTLAGMVLNIDAREHENMVMAVAKATDQKASDVQAKLKEGKTFVQILNEKGM